MRARSLRMHTSTMLASKEGGGRADMNDPPPKKDELSLGEYPNLTRTFARFRGRRAARVWLCARRLWGSIALENGVELRCCFLLRHAPIFANKDAVGLGKAAEMVIEAFSERNAKGEFKSNPSKDRNPAPVRGKV